VVSSQAGAPEIVMMATYHDILTRDARPLEIQAAHCSRGYSRPEGRKVIRG